MSEEVNGPQKFAIKITHAHFKVCTLAAQNQVWLSVHNVRSHDKPALTVCSISLSYPCQRLHESCVEAILQNRLWLVMLRVSAGKLLKEGEAIFTNYQRP